MANLKYGLCIEINLVCVLPYNYNNICTIL